MASVLLKAISLNAVSYLNGGYMSEFDDESEQPSLEDIYNTEEDDEYSAEDLFIRDVFRANDL